jgi:hypothetical protein
VTGDVGGLGGEELAAALRDAGARDGDEIVVGDRAYELT